MLTDLFPCVYVAILLDQMLDYVTRDQFSVLIVLLSCCCCKPDVGGSNEKREHCPIVYCFFLITC